MDFFLSPAMATETTSAATAAQASGVAVPYELSPEKMMWDNMIILGVLFAIFYFVLIQPQRRRVKQHDEMMKSLQKGSKIISNGGIIGTIIKFEGDDVVVVEISQGVRVRMAKSSIAEIAGDHLAGSSSANDN